MKKISHLGNKDLIKLNDYNCTFKTLANDYIQKSIQEYQLFLLLTVPQVSVQLDQDLKYMYVYVLKEIIRKINEYTYTCIIQLHMYMYCIHTSTQTDRHTNTQTDRHTNTQTDRHIYIDAHTDQHTDRRTDTYIQTHTQTHTDCRHKQTDRHIYTDTDRRTDTHSYTVVIQQYIIKFGIPVCKLNTN